MSAVIRRNVPLAPLTTYKFGGPARVLVEAESEEDVLAAVEVAGAEGLPVFVLGRGSNVVVSDAGFDGVVIRPGGGLALRSLDDEGVLTAGAAAPLPVVARETAKAGRGGLEFFTGIPGSVGGAVKMNAGCHGSETSEWLLSARIVSLSDGGVDERGAADLDMRYRHTNLADADMVVSARFRTIAREPEAAETTIREITRWRRLHQPGGTLNAGSVFKNPEGDAAGRLIDSLGLKGFRVGGVEVSERHANFFVAHPGAGADDVRRLVDEVRARVKEATGVDLEPEIRFLGEFG